MSASSLKARNLACLRIVRKNCERRKIIQQSSHPHLKQTGFVFFLAHSSA